MTRWLVSPIVLATLGVGAGLFVLQLDLTGRVLDWNILVPLAAAAAIVSFPLTLVLLRFEAHATITLRDHLRHMWLAYPFWALGSLGLGGGHGAILYIIP